MEWVGLVWVAQFLATWIISEDEIALDDMTKKTKNHDLILVTIYFFDDIVTRIIFHLNLCCFHSNYNKRIIYFSITSMIRRNNAHKHVLHMNCDNIVILI